MHLNMTDWLGKKFGLLIDGDPVRQRTTIKHEVSLFPIGRIDKKKNMGIDCGLYAWYTQFL